MKNITTTLSAALSTAASIKQRPLYGSRSTPILDVAPAAGSTPIIVQRTNGPILSMRRR